METKCLGQRPTCLFSPASSPSLPPLASFLDQEETRLWSLTRMGPTSAEIETWEWAAVARVQGHRPGKVELLQGHGTVEDILRETGPHG